METIKRHTFNIYRYQILPISEEFQIQFDPQVSSMDELRERKNEFFAEALNSIEEFEHHRAELIHKLVSIGESYFLIKLGVKRDLKRLTREFQEEAIENWPFIYILIDNNPNSQLAIIQKDRRVFYRTSTVANILENNINRIISRYQLTVRFAPTFEEKEFWNIIDAYPEKIIQVDFEIISPNITNISKNLALDLFELSKNTNTRETHLQLNSDKESHLTISKDDDMINGIVNYSSQGGGNIMLKIKGFRKRFNTARNVREIELDELTISSLSTDKLNDVISDLLK